MEPESDQKSKPSKHFSSFYSSLIVVYAYQLSKILLYTAIIEYNAWMALEQKVTIPSDNFTVALLLCGRLSQIGLDDLRIFLNFFRAALGNLDTMIHTDDPITNPHDYLHIMLDQ